MSEFNRQRMMENVNELIKEKGLKVGEVESAIGVSTGYISRLTKRNRYCSISRYCLEIGKVSGRQYRYAY